MSESETERSAERATLAELGLSSAPDPVGVTLRTTAEERARWQRYADELTPRLGSGWSYSTDETLLAAERGRLSRDIDTLLAEIARLRAQAAPAPVVEEDLHTACEPWAFHQGPPPSDDSPLSGVFGAGMGYTEQLLAKLLGVTKYDGGDGSEDFDCDATKTLENILVAAKLYDPEDGRWAAISTPASDAQAWRPASPPTSEVERLRRLLLPFARHLRAAADFLTAASQINEESGE